MRVNSQPDVLYMKSSGFYALTFQIINGIKFIKFIFILALKPLFFIYVVLVAQLLKYTKKKLHKNYRFCIFNHARKKEFHASIIRFG